MFPGRVEDWDGSPLWSVYETDHGASRHMSNVFNVFVILQIFNLINARKINDEYNILDNVFSNGTYCIILLIIFGG